MLIRLRRLVCPFVVSQTPEDRFSRIKAHKGVTDQNSFVFLILKIAFVLANGADPDEMLHCGISL